MKPRRTVFYLSDRTGQSNLWLVSTDGSHDVQVTNNGGQNQLYCPLWSPDGKRIAYAVQNSVSADGKQSHSVFVIEPETHAASRDGLRARPEFARLHAAVA